MARKKKGSDTAKEMRNQPRTRPAAQQCPKCGEWSSFPHPHIQQDTQTDKPARGGR